MILLCCAGLSQNPKSGSQPYASQKRGSAKFKVLALPNVDPKQTAELGREVIVY